MWILWVPIWIPFGLVTGAGGGHGVIFGADPIQEGVGATQATESGRENWQRQAASKTGNDRLQVIWQRLAANELPRQKCEAYNWPLPLNVNKLLSVNQPDA